MKKYLISAILLTVLTMNLMAQTTIDTTIKNVILGDILIQDNTLDKVVHSTTVNDEIQNHNQVKNVADLFKEINGFSLVKRSAYAIDPVFRSFKYEQLNVQYDGGCKAMHACPNRMDPITTFVIPEEIEKIEIIRGPFSVRYGANFGGVVNMVTHRAPRINEMGLHGNVLAGYETNGGSVTTSAGIGYANTKYDVLLNASMRDYGNYMDGNGTEVSSSFKSYDYSVKTGYNVSKNQRVQFGLRQSFGRDIKHAGLPMDSEHDNSTILSADYKIKNISNRIYSFQAKAFYSYVDHLMTNADRKNFKVVEANTPVNATTYGGKMEFQLLLSDQHVLYVGADHNGVKREGNRNKKVKRNPKNPEIVFDVPKLFVDSIWQDATINDIGLFAEGKYEMNSNLAFGYGLRMDYVHSEIKSPVAEFSNRYDDFEDIGEFNFSGHLSLNHQLTKNLNVQLAIGRGVRSASMEEKYINHLGVNKDPYEYVGNPLLEAEANHQIEMNITGKVSNVKYGTNLFYSYITDYITAAVDSTIKRKYLPFKEPKVAKRFQNIDVATQTGLELFVEIPIVKYLSIKGDIAYIKSHNKDWNEPLAQVSPLTSVLTIKYQRDNFWTDVRTKFVTKQDQISLKYGESITPGYNVLDFRIGFKPLKNLTIAGSVLNMFDEYYYDHLNFSFVNSTTDQGKIYEQGRNFNIFLRYDF